MNYSAKSNDDIFVKGEGVSFYPIFKSGNAPIEGCSASVGVYDATEYPAMGVHDDNEGFYVLEGCGKAVCADVEFDIVPGTAFYAPAGVAHAIKKNIGSQDIKIFLHHFPK